MDRESVASADPFLRTNDQIDGASLIPHAMIGVDWGLRHRGFAHKPAQLSMAMPSGEYEIDDTSAGIAMTRELVQRYHATYVVIGRVADHQQRIMDVVEQLGVMLPADVHIACVNEAYTSVMAGEQLRHADRYASSHALASVQIIERALAGGARGVTVTDKKKRWGHGYEGLM